MGNPRKGMNVLPYLQRRREGRALRAVGPSALLELSRTVGEITRPARWPFEVATFIILSLLHYMITIGLERFLHRYLSIKR
jgi:hypothetical protein